MEMLAIPVNALMGLWVIIVRHGIIVITKAVLEEERVLMENLIILAVVVVVFLVRTVNMTIVLIIYVRMGALAKVVRITTLVLVHQIIWEDFVKHVTIVIDKTAVVMENVIL